MDNIPFDEERIVATLSELPGCDSGPIRATLLALADATNKTRQAHEKLDYRPPCADALVLSASHALRWREAHLRENAPVPGTTTRFIGDGGLPLWDDGLLKAAADAPPTTRKLVLQQDFRFGNAIVRGKTDATHVARSCRVSAGCILLSGRRVRRCVVPPVWDTALAAQTANPLIAGRRTIWARHPATAVCRRMRACQTVEGSADATEVRRAARQAMARRSGSARRSAMAGSRSLAAAKSVPAMADISASPPSCTGTGTPFARASATMGMMPKGRSSVM